MPIDRPTAFLAMLALGACVSASLAEARPLTTEQARAAIAPFYKALNDGGDAVALVNQATLPEWESCPSNGTCRKRDQVGAGIAGLRKAVPNLKWEIKELLVAGDRVIVRGEASGTPAGPFMGVQPGGKSFRIMAIDIHTIKDGKMVRSYHVEDWLGAVRQLSAQ